MQPVAQSFVTAQLLSTQYCGQDTLLPAVQFHVGGSTKGTTEVVIAPVLAFGKYLMNGKGFPKEKALEKAFALAKMKDLGLNLE